MLTRAVALAPQVRWDQDVVDLATRDLASLGDDVEPRVAGDAARINAWILFFMPGPAATFDEVVAVTNRLPALIRPLAFAHCGFQALLAHEEHLGDAVAGYGTDVNRDLIRAWWSLRCPSNVRWLDEHGFGPPEEMPKVAVLRSRP